VALLDGPREVAVVGDPGDPVTVALRRTALRGTAPGAAVATGPPGSPVPLLAGRPLVGGSPAAYVCRLFVCERPVTTQRALAQMVLATHPAAGGGVSPGGL